MAQFFNHEQAENFRSDVMVHFPQLVATEVHDIHENETKVYQYSYFSIWFVEYRFHYYVNSEEDWQAFLSVCQYVASAIADNQQSEEVASHTCKNCQGVFSSLYYGLCEDCYDATPLGLEHEIGRSFVDQNGVRVIPGQVYTVEEYEAMAREQDIDPHVSRYIDSAIADNQQSEEYAKGLPFTNHDWLARQSEF